MTPPQTPSETAVRLLANIAKHTATTERKDPEKAFATIYFLIPADDIAAARLWLSSADGKQSGEGKCIHDTDGDGNCHLCHRRGGCFYKSGLTPINPPPQR